jgi:L-ascorbate metabolism protein UlaG (beta-lactamase superfamily)
MQITWFGHSAFRLDFAGKAVLIDPFSDMGPDRRDSSAAGPHGADRRPL